MIHPVTGCEGCSNPSTFSGFVAGARRTFEEQARRLRVVPQQPAERALMGVPPSLVGVCSKSVGFFTSADPSARRQPQIFTSGTIIKAEHTSGKSAG
jgi:hypothetical protein